LMWVFFRDQGLILWIFIVLLAIFTAIRVIIDTRSATKTAAYLLLIVLLPIGGPILYFLVGVNYRKRRIYNKKLISNEKLFEEIKTSIVSNTLRLENKHHKFLAPYEDLVELIVRESVSPLTTNRVTLLNNGEQKFPALFEALENARQHIHLEYFIFDDDEIGNKVKDILIRKAKEGVAVRLIFDDFGSHKLWRNIVDELEQNGVQVFPFYRIWSMLLANRLNYRDHRKIVVIDGKIGFIGGINISSRYLNNHHSPKKLYWRDTHIKIEGTAVFTLQYHFLGNWNFCSGDNLGLHREFFPEHVPSENGSDMVQIVASGPDYPRPSVMLTYFTAIMLAKNCVYITSPYFIPNESILNAIKKAALSGRDVRLLLPGISDTKLVNAASRFYFLDLLYSGVKIYLYQKGFVHAKTMVVDNGLAIVGTTNMDLRSFELNFEIDAVVYSERINTEMKESFLRDLESSEQVTLEEWKKHSKLNMLVYALARIFAPLL
jgi:cardiolipin synthase